MAGGTWETAGPDASLCSRQQPGDHPLAYRRLSSCAAAAGVIRRRRLWTIPPPYRRDVLSLPVAFSRLSGKDCHSGTATQPGVLHGLSRVDRVQLPGGGPVYSLVGGHWRDRRTRGHSTADGQLLVMGHKKQNNFLWRSFM